MTIDLRVFYAPKRWTDKKPLMCGVHMSNWMKATHQAGMQYTGFMEGAENFVTKGILKDNARWRAHLALSALLTKRSSSVADVAGSPVVRRDRPVFPGCLHTACSFRPLSSNTPHSSSVSLKIPRVLTCSPFHRGGGNKTNKMIRAANKHHEGVLVDM